MSGFNFTDQVRKVIAIARAECARMHYEQLDTEHLLLGIICEGEGVAVAALGTFNPDFQEIVKSINARPPQLNRPEVPHSDVPFTSQAKKVMELGMAEAQDLNHSYVGTEHLILGLLRFEKGTAAQLLMKQGITLESLRTEIRRLLGAEVPGAMTNTRRQMLRPLDRGIVSVTVEVRLADGTVVRNESRSALVAMAFLRRQLAQPEGA